jgi:hypothetical protein
MSTDQNTENRPAARRRLRLVLAVVVIAAVVAVVGVLATSSSGTKSTSTTQQSASHSSRLASLQPCLRKEGIDLSAPSGGAGQPTAGNGAAHAGLKLPEGVSRTKFQEAVKKCGGGSLPRGGGAHESPRAESGAA